MSIYVSLGAQCTTTELFKRLGIKKETLPFDWILSTPEFVYTILKLLLVDNAPYDEIIKNHFCVFDKRAALIEREYYITTESGTIPFNSKYGVSFPHDNPHDLAKYYRRIQRLKEFILDKKKYIYFVYVSLSTPGIYTFDGKELIHDVHPYIQKINTILFSVRKNYKILIFDTDLPKNLPDNLNIRYFSLEKTYMWNGLLPELESKFRIFVKNHTRKIRKRGVRFTLKKRL